jgi:thiazole synthase
MTAGALELGGRTFGSRLIIGTGKYDSPEVMADALEASGAEIITVAVRRVDLDASKEESLLHWLDPERVLILPNTAGCYSAEEAIRVARLGRAAGLSDFVKLEVIGDEKTLYPDVVELIAATETLAREGFTVLPYTSDDPVVARRLEEAGAAAVMPLASPIGSGLGLVDPLGIRFILEAVSVPVIVDAGVGTASDAAATMELGVDGILMNTAIAKADDPVRMAKAMRLAVQAGRLAFEAGRMERRAYASPSSPVAGRVGA